VKSVISIALFLILAIANYAIAEEKVNSYPFRLGTSPKIQADKQGNLYISYYLKDGSLIIKRLDDRHETVIRDENADGSLNELSFLKDKILLTWRPKDGKGYKYVYVQESDDGGKTFSKPVTINTGQDALALIATANDGKDRYYAVWLDERKAYRLYMNYTLDGGKTFLKEDILLTPDFRMAINPQLILDGDAVNLFFMGFKKEGENYSIYHAASKDKGRTWEEPKKLYEIGEWSPYTIKAVNTRGGTTVFWAGIWGLHGLYSKDMNNWEKISFKDSEMNDVNRFEVEVRRNAVYIVVSYDKKPAKQNVYLYRSLDSGRTWEGPVRLNRNEYENTRAWFPLLSVSKDGKEVLAVWQDHRDIRGNIYINYSGDGGKTWLERDVRIGRKDTNEAYPYAIFSKGQHHIVWFRFTNDEVRDNVDLFITGINGELIKKKGKEQAAIKEITPEEKEKLLKERVNAMWDAQIRRDRRVMYDLYDPFFRARVTKDWFGGQNMPAHYNKADIQELNIKGNVADVKVKIVFEIKGVMLLGKLHSEPPKESITSETWLFVDGNWYRQFIDYITEGSIAVY